MLARPPPFEQRAGRYVYKNSNFPNEEKHGRNTTARRLPEDSRRVSLLPSQGVMKLLSSRRGHHLASPPPRARIIRDI